MEIEVIRYRPDTDKRTMTGSRGSSQPKERFVNRLIAEAQSWQKREELTEGSESTEHQGCLEIVVRVSL